MQVENVPDPKILNRRDAIVKITSTAICGSDLHLYDGYVPTMKRGDILGHEFMGEVVEVGKGIDDLRVGDRVVVPFPIACGDCWSCRHELYSACENSNPNAGMAEKIFGHPTAGIFGYSHLTGGYAGGQAEYARVPFADVGPFKIADDLEDEQVLFLSDILPTGYFGADLCDIKGGDVIAALVPGKRSATRRSGFQFKLLFNQPTFCAEVTADGIDPATSLEVAVENREHGSRWNSWSRFCPFGILSQNHFSPRIC